MEIGEKMLVDIYVGQSYGKLGNFIDRQKDVPVL